MNTKNTPPVMVEYTINAPANRVWEALTDINEIRQWSFDMSDFKPEVGFEFHMSGGKEGSVYIHNCKILEVTENKLLKHTWAYEGIPGASVVTYELFPQGNKTKVKLTHEGLGNLQTDNPDFDAKNFHEGWNAIIGQNLVNYLEHK